MHELFTRFPLKGEHAQLHFVRPEGELDWTRVTFQLWDFDDGELAGIKEQQVFLLPLNRPPEERERAYLEALFLAIEEIFEGGRSMEDVFPHELLSFSDTPLKLRRAQSVEDFQAALRTKKRLGRFLPG